MRRATLSDSDKPSETDTTPVAWFVEMIHALNRGDLIRALEAQRQLKQEGFSVSFHRTPECERGQR